MGLRVVKAMSSDALVVTLNNTSAQLRVALLNTSAKQQATIFASDENIPFDWAQFLSITTFSREIPRMRYSEAYQTMLASERILRVDWEQPEEDAAWADL
jgi:hypothetical protein